MPPGALGAFARECRLRFSHGPLKFGAALSEAVLSLKSAGTCRPGCGSNIIIPL
jgi:hypothetical protein